MEALIEKQPVRYVFSESEINGMAKEQARKFTLRRLAEEEKKQVGEQIKAKITGLEAEISGLTSRIESGYEMKLTRVLTLKYRPTIDEKLTVRLDSGLCMGRFRLSQDERQLELRDTDYSHVVELLMEDGTESVKVPIVAEEAKAFDGLDVALRPIEAGRMLEAKADAQ